MADVTTVGADGAEPDLWDRYAPDAYWRPLPPRTLTEAMSGECESLYLRGERGDGGAMAWTLERGEPPIHVAGPFPDLAEAKAKGEEAASNAWDGHGARIVADAGLDPDEWAFVDGGNPGFESLVETGVALVPEEGGWQVLSEGDLDVPVHATPLAAVEARAAERRPSP